MGRHSLDQWTPPIRNASESDELNFKYEDAAIYENLVAIGQPDGSVTVVDLDKGLHAEFQVYEHFGGIPFRWCDILMNKHYIVCASVESNQKVKVFSHSGDRLNKFFPLPNGRPYMISDHKVLILS